MPTVKSSAVRSRPAVASPGMGAPPKPPATASGAARTRSGTPAQAMSAPAAPPAAARSSASVSLRAHQVASSGPERAPHRQVATPVLRAHREQAGHVRARDQEHDRDRAEQNPQCRRDIADKLLAEWFHDRPVTLHDPHVRRRTAQPLLNAPCERLELRHQRGAVRSRLHAGDHARPETARRDLAPALSTSGTQNATRSSGNRNSGFMMPITVRFPPAKK